jgi:hypothetical protein
MIRNELLSMLADDRITIPTDRLLELLGDMNFFADCPPPELVAMTGSDDTMRELLSAMWSAGYRDAMKAVMTLIPRTEPQSRAELMAKLTDALTSWEKHPKYGDNVPRGDVIQAADELATLAAEMLDKLKAPTGE